METQYQIWKAAIREAARLGKMEHGQGTLGQAFRIGRAGAAAPGWAPARTFARAAWQVGNESKGE